MQTANLNRVKTKIGTLVTQFITNKWLANTPYFTAAELRGYIQLHTNTAPASPDRILRQLRLEGKFDYQVVNRKASEYQILGIGGSGAQKKRTAKLIYDGRVVDSFEFTGRRFKLPKHVLDHIFSSNDFELQI